MEPNIEELKNTYSKFSDEALIKLATKEASSLRKDALIALLGELTLRNLPQEVIDGVLLQLNYGNEGALENLCNFVRQLPCPRCGLDDKKLNANIVNSVLSIIVWSDWTQELRIACPDCLDLYHSKGNLFTLFCGWWALPGGLYMPLLAFWGNYKQKKLNHQPSTSPFLIEYVSQNLGKIKSNKKNPKMLKAMLSNATIKSLEKTN